MTKTQYFEFHRKMCDFMIDVTKKKNADYTGGNDDPFSNFTLIERIGGCSTEQGFLTRMSDKLARIASFVTNKQLAVKSESVQDTLLDLANYCILMAGYIESKKDFLNDGVKTVEFSAELIHVDKEKLKAIIDGGMHV